ncbi:chemotaxis protein CheW [Lampropedia puyangensis]|uniref:Chemotaxis protein CheW n=1 Tax=Lampropedia puyangensis TaxID=1330072 RepID=A0A4S8EWU0_9BURK|nr:chemotaxis protein CheW [Lampropedia puyangensis]THT98988.1 chemotaxis protein CheW [Lampropedia puyangensis]
MSPTTSFSIPLAQPADGTSAYLSFTLAQETYGVDVAFVREIRHYQIPTRIANTPDFVKGVLHLHGAIVPVMDLRIRFQCAEAEYGPFTVMVVLQLGARMVAVVVDSVTDVSDVLPSAIEPVPAMRSVIHSSCFTGLVQRETHMLILLDADRLIQEVDDWLQAHEAASETTALTT